MSRKVKALEARRLNMVSAQSMSNEQAISMPGMYPAWSGDGVQYGEAEKGQPVIVSYNGQLYRCISAHTSQDDWTPNTAVSLWVACADPAEEWPEWKQPAGAHDAYSLGAKVTHNDAHWISTADNNVWEPGVYGWEKQE